jgi:hypothetical protein
MWSVYVSFFIAVIFFVCSCVFLCYFSVFFSTFHIFSKLWATCHSLTRPIKWQDPLPIVITNFSVTNSNLNLKFSTFSIVITYHCLQLKFEFKVFNIFKVDSFCAIESGYCFQTLSWLKSAFLKTINNGQLQLQLQFERKVLIAQNVFWMKWFQIFGIGSRIMLYHNYTFQLQNRLAFKKYLFFIVSKFISRIYIICFKNITLNLFFR